MRLQPGNTSLVLAGSWNPAILTPTWIAQHGLGYAPDREFQVGMQLAVQEFGQFPRFMFETLSVNATPSGLTFSLDSDNAVQVAKSFEVAVRILRALSHTPVVGIGVNFSFADDVISEQVSASFAGHDQLLAALPGEQQDAEIVQQSWQATVKLSDHLANVTCNKIGQGVEVAFNHHFNVTSAEGAAIVLAREGLYAELLEISKALIHNLGNEE